MLASLLMIFAVSTGDFRSGDECLDSALIGVWYRLTTRHPGHPFPIQSVNAFEVTDSGQIVRLGIEARTGRLTDGLGSHDRAGGKILCARGGTLVLRHLTVPAMSVDTMQYRVRGDTLSVEGRPISGQFQRGELGTRIAAPVEADVLATVGDVERRNDAVATRIPTAHLRGRRWGRVQFWANITMEDFSSAWIRVEIRRYRGPGKYAIGPGQAELALVAGDAITLHASGSPASGFIHIHSCERSGRRCVGEFEFVGDHSSTRTYTEWRRRIRGRFSVPLYPF